MTQLTADRLLLNVLREEWLEASRHFDDEAFRASLPRVIDNSEKRTGMNRSKVAHLALEVYNETHGE